MQTLRQNRDIVSRMAKKKTGGEHVTPRKSIQMPMEWYKLAFKLASKKKQPILWYLMSRLASDADTEAIERPPLPWEAEKQ